MTRTIGRTAAASLISGLFGAAWVALFYAWHPALRIEFDRDLPANITGVHPPERDEAAQRTFAWTSRDAVLRLPGLDRGCAWTLELRMRGGREARDNADYTVFADGVALTTERAPFDWTSVRVVIPARPERRGLTLGLHASQTFVPGPGDPRTLGVMLDSLSLTPERIVLVPRPALGAVPLASAAMGGAIALLGVTAGSAIAGGVLLSAGVAAVVARGLGPFTGYTTTAVWLGFWIAAALAIASLVVEAQRRRPLRNTARFAAACSASALLLKLLVLLHPDMPIGDAMFHAHRFQTVLAGNLYFTSIAPGGYHFPYAPGLYVFASAFAGLVRRGAADMALLRIVTCTVDAIAAVVLYRVVDVVWRDRLAAAAAVAIYHLMPIDFAVLTTGNLTNAFAQSVAVGALVLMSVSVLTTRSIGIGVALAAVLAAAYLSHTSTIAIVFTATMLTAAAFAIRGDRRYRRAAAVVAIASLAAAAIAVAIYYAHFVDTYRAEFARIAHETSQRAVDAGGRSAGDRLRGVPYSIGINVGWPILLLAIIGGVQRVRRRAGDGLDLSTAAWFAACVLFLVVGILTPVDMRYYLAAVPALAIAAGCGAASAWNGSTAAARLRWRIPAGVLIGAAILTGFRNWWDTLG